MKYSVLRAAASSQVLQAQHLRYLVFDEEEGDARYTQALDGFKIWTDKHDCPESFQILAIHDGEPVGTMRGTFRKDVDGEVINDQNYEWSKLVDQLSATSFEEIQGRIALIDRMVVLEGHRREGVASMMRRIGFCEERGSGIDKVVVQTEIYQLPAPIFEAFDEHTRTVLFAYREFKEMDREEKVRACYLHAVLKHLNRQPMSNTTLRDRFGIDPQNSATASRIIKQAVEAGVIKPYDETAGSKAMRYVPHWKQE